MEVAKHFFCCLFVYLSPLISVSHRWFDKSIQLIVARGGHAAINFEHSWGDGVAVLRLFEELYRDKKNMISSDQSTMEGVVRLEFDLSPRVKSGVEEARKEVESRCKTLSVNTLQYTKYGKDYIKKLQLSPDALLQLSIQVRPLSLAEHTKYSGNSETLGM